MKRKHIILGASGHVGSATAAALLERSENVTVVVRDPTKGEPWKSRGATVAVADVLDSDALRAVFRAGDRAFLLNPPAPPSMDTDAEEHKSFRSIVRALDESGLSKVVAESTYGAQAGGSVGDLSVLYDFEQALRAQPTPATIIRAAYYMSNWDAFLQPIRETRRLTTMYPPQVQVPMVAPRDIGRVAARLLCEDGGVGNLLSVEGPARYTSADVAEAFAEALGHPVALEVIPRKGWEEAYRRLGFSHQAARAYARMTAVSVEGGFELPDRFERGEVTLGQYIARLCKPLQAEGEHLHERQDL